MARIVIIEDNEDVRLGWKHFITINGKHEVVGDYENCEDFLKNLDNIVRIKWILT